VSFFIYYFFIYKFPGVRDLFSILSSVILIFRKEVAMMPNPVQLDSTFTGASLPSLFPVMKENISPSRILSTMDPEGAGENHTPFKSCPSTPTGKKHDVSALGQPSPAGHQFALGGHLPNWVKAKVICVCVYSTK